jgi:hypothetical protein
MSRRRLLVLLLGGALVAACNSPSLPLPPPLTPGQSASSDGNPDKVRLTGEGAISGSLLITYNVGQPLDRRVTGTEVGTDGKWAIDIWAKKGDAVEIWQEVGTTRSGSVSITIK